MRHRIMNRADLKKLAKLRVKDAEVLLNSRRHEGAYYLLGYAVECAFKACIAKRIKQFEFPDRKLVNDMYTHDLTKLLSISGLAVEHNEESKNNVNFQENWLIVKDWTEQARYSTKVTQAQTKDFYVAVTDPRNGVLSWLQRYW